MKNLYLLPTDKPSRLYKTGNFLLLDSKAMPNNTLETKNQHIYITSDEEIKDVRPHKGKWQLEQGNILNKFPNYLTDLSECKLVIMTTDQDLIKDGVQAIDDIFLEWFVKNPSCEFVEIFNQNVYSMCKWDARYSIIIPKEEPKQELPAYLLISNYYGQTKTKRSDVPLINHIDEGIEILKGIGADEDTIEAYCLHPILQSDEEFNKNLTMDFSGISTSAILLAVEYRRVANSYLSTDKIENFVGFTNEKIKQMLYADKIQNEKDFALYHEGKHDRSKELREYFNNWLNILLK